MSAEAEAASSDYVRLHITPLDPDLIKVVLSASVAPKARNISYHTIDTFPERRYGYVELPTMEADKLKKKLNGATLKGTKVKIEKARPEKKIEPTAELDKADEEQEKKHKKIKESKEEKRKRKRNPEILEGVALTDRKVKRGWTEPADQRRKKSKLDKEKEKDGKYTEKKKRLKSKHTEGDECLLKTKVPPNLMSTLTEDDQPRKRKKKGKDREVVVHEFEKTTKFPSFLKNSADGEASKTTEYVEGKGWVDEEGNVVETVKEKKKVGEPTPKKKKAKKATPPPESDDETSDSGTSSSGSSSDEDEDESEDEMEVDAKVEKKEEKTTKETPQKDDESSSDESSDEVSPEQPQQATPLSAIKADDSRPPSRDLTIKIPPPLTPSTNIHPLEALYKRSNPDQSATETPVKKEAEPFSFFSGGDDDDDIENEEDQDPANQTIATPGPMTPFSRQDFEWRGVRSAAPTPDTAHPSRMRNFWPEDEEEGDEDADMAEHGYDEEEGEKGASGPQSSSDFQAWFWDNRRDLNRSWMKRRKTAAKEKRHKENKARASKAM
ncbi:hypothetical protein FVEN_g9967 [Fusarium venenatum]|uniref:RRM domain-containing protein n=1 Tax=Fusarium venenatum TaxID=56646 RepID=A0A2L2SVU4_9HYPO|nr:uncharacterized protein FVRRES_04985 [Fusarium venenatum]KAG8351921.1 hypothetical protein FVEN_g9967 [Fusarium venenatum]KAH6992111.1 hypothetical protein EDB82DRAFT_495267 [Fusarium venenatum]CEI60549.1 unnamed protein product [Fusarium venenatum]